MRSSTLKVLDQIRANRNVANKETISCNARRSCDLHCCVSLIDFHSGQLQENTSSKVSLTEIKCVLWGREYTVPHLAARCE